MDSQADKIVALTEAANVDLEPIWASLLAKALEGKNVKELLSNVGSGGGGPAQAVVGGGGAGGGAPADAPAKEEEKEEEKEESDEDMVCFSPVYLQKFHLTDHLFRASVFSIDLPETCSCTPSRVQMYLYSSHTFPLSAISPSRMRPEMNDTLEGVCDTIIYPSSRIEMVCNLHDVLRGLIRSQLAL